MLSIVLLAGLGLAAGSFLNVCIYRLPRDVSVASPSSRCVACHRPLEWFENIPVVSWAALGGRCRTCRASLGITYPLVELLTAAVFVYGYLMYGWTPLLAARLLFACAMIVLSVIDLRHHLLPNAITIPGIGIGLLLNVFLPPGWRASLLGLAAGGGVLFAMAETYYRLRGHEGLGMGDVKMLAMIGAFLGWQLMLVTLVLASIAGSIIGIALIASRRGGLQTALPFGTFLAAAGLVAAVAGDPLIRWYLASYR